MTRMNVHTLSKFMSCVFAAGLLCSSATRVEAAAKKKRGGGVSLPQLEQEVQTVTLKNPGKRGGISQKELKVHVSYSTATMDAFIDLAGDLYVQPKVSSPGDKVCGDIVIAPRYRYLEKKEGRPKTHHRRVVGLTSSVAPSRNPKVVTINFELEQGVRSTVVYSFDGKKIDAEVDCVDPKGIEIPTRPQFETRIPPSHDLPVETSMAVKKKVTKDCMLSLKSQKHRYAVPAKASGKDRVSSGVITGQWPGCKVMLSAKPGLGLWVYGGSFLLEGYHIVLGDPDKPTAKKSLGISVVQAP